MNICIYLNMTNLESLYIYTVRVLCQMNYPVDIIYYTYLNFENSYVNYCTANVLGISFTY